MAKASTGLRNKMLDTNSLDGLLNGGLIKIYKGTVPASADDAVSDTDRLVTISLNSTGSGINFDTAASGGSLAKAPAEVWSGVNAATNTATFYRHVAPGDDGTSSTTQARLQGTVGTSGADLNLSSTSLVSGATQTIDYYSVSFPTL